MCVCVCMCVRTKQIKCWPCHNFYYCNFYIPTTKHLSFVFAKHTHTIQDTPHQNTQVHTHIIQDTPHQKHTWMHTHTHKIQDTPHQNTHAHAHTPQVGVCGLTHEQREAVFQHTQPISSCIQHNHSTYSGKRLPFDPGSNVHWGCDGAGGGVVWSQHIAWCVPTLSRAHRPITVQ